MKHFLTTLCTSWLLTIYRTPWANAQSRDMWIERIWREGEFDLIHWGGKHRKRMTSAVRALKALVPPQPFPFAEFWEQAKLQPKEEFDKHGAAWTIQFIIYCETQAKIQVQKEKQAKVDKILESEDWMNDFGGMGLGSVLPEWLDEQVFEQPIVQDLMTEDRRECGSAREGDLEVLDASD
jgi:hypothetical protein